MHAVALILVLAAAQEHLLDRVPNYDVPIHGQGSFCPSKDGNVYFEKEGSGPPVIVVAGGPGGSHASFHPFFSRLAGQHTVIYFDSIGRGRSDRLKDKGKYTVQRDAEDIEAIRKYLGYEQVSVIGHSYGGMPALAYAIKYPKNLRRLVLSDTLHSAAGFQDNIDACNDHVRRQHPDVWEKLMAARAKGVKSSDDAYQELYGSSFNDIYFYDEGAARRLFRSGDPKDGFNSDIYGAMLGDDPEWKVGGAMSRFDARPGMRRLRVPTLICVGRYDRVALPKVAYEMSKLIPGSKLEVFEKSGHRPWLEESDLYFDRVLEFLR